MYLRVAIFLIEVEWRARLTFQIIFIYILRQSDHNKILKDTNRRSVVVTKYGALCLFCAFVRECNFYLAFLKVLMDSR